MTPKRSPPCLAVPAWNESTSPIILCTIPGVGQKDSQSGPERKYLTQEYLETNYPKESWTHGYTDGSAENAVRNGGAGVYIQYAGGKEDKISVATGLYSTNCKAEAEALKTAAAHIEASTHASPNVVLLTDALSVLQALQSNRDTELNDLSAALASLCRGHAVILQWIPSHCNVPGNEAPDSLAKEGTTQEQVDRSTSYPEVKTILKAKQHSKWRHEHPRYNKADPLLPVNQTGTSDSVQTQDRPQQPQLSPIFQTPHRPYRAVPLWYWQSDNRTSTAVLPHLQATQKGNLARPRSHSPQALRKPEGPAMHCHLHRGDWNFHLTNEKKKKKKKRHRLSQTLVPALFPFTFPHH